MKVIKFRRLAIARRIRGQTYEFIKFYESEARTSFRWRKSHGGKRKIDAAETEEKQLAWDALALGLPATKIKETILKRDGESFTMSKLRAK